MGTPKVQLPTKVASKEENHPMIEKKKVHGGTKTNHVVFPNQMSDGGFVVKASSLKS
jgi:hypothetical protein